MIQLVMRTESSHWAEVCGLCPSLTQSCPLHPAMSWPFLSFSGPSTHKQAHHRPPFRLLCLRLSDVLGIVALFVLLCVFWLDEFTTWWGDRTMLASTPYKGVDTEGVNHGGLLPVCPPHSFHPQINRDPKMTVCPGHNLSELV